MIIYTFYMNAGHEGSTVRIYRILQSPRFPIVQERVK